MLNRSRIWLLFIIVLLLPCMETAAATNSTINITDTSLEDPSHSSVMSGTTSQEDAKRKKRSSSKDSLSLSQLMKRYPNTFKSRGPRVKQVALTFDDVPDPRFTPQVLDVLKQEGVKATFFVIGNRAEKHPKLVARMKREGHAIGNHSYNHAEFPKLTLPQFQNQIERTNQILQRITGIKPRLIRPPYGEINEEQLRWARKNNYKVVNWNVDSLDWKGLNKEEVKNNILSAVGPGAIVLQHAGGGVGSDLTGTIEALPEVIAELKKKGYSFVTLPEMLGVTEGL
ncbi:polysaccharide deacetylase family protein [Paenibacillus faecalis]|uniref:polysaccharide deacetylase family protein n=1 Tax=Paenibacillus faecalis TaxID=2079532 RepID=UPI000D0FE9DA|nr:polysaccharide deacetylase family protein [Paenibacillus faecalis]